MRHDVYGFGAEVARALFGVITGDGVGSHPVPAPALSPEGPQLRLGELCAGAWGLVAQFPALLPGRSATARFHVTFAAPPSRTVQLRYS